MCQGLHELEVRFLDERDHPLRHGLVVDGVRDLIGARGPAAVDRDLQVDCRRAARTDEVADTVDYKAVAKRVIAFVEESDFKLVETLAHRMAMLVLEEFSLQWVRICVNKPGAIRGSRDVGVCVERTRADLEPNALEAR